MSYFSPEHVRQLISADGYWWVGVIIALESVGLPLPGEITLLVAAGYAGTTHRLDIGLVIAAAAAGTIAGANLGFWIGQEVGYRLLLRFGHYVGLNEARIKVGQYLFFRYGAKVVFFGRFIALLRTVSAPLAGLNRMPWRRFFVATTVGGVTWASVYGLGAFYFGKEMGKFAHSFAIGLGVTGAIGIAIAFLVLRRHEAALMAKAELAFPGPLRPLREHANSQA